jgi:hypothetical protein
VGAALDQRLEFFEKRRFQGYGGRWRAASMDAGEAAIIAPKYRFQIEYLGFGTENFADDLHGSPLAL